MESVKVESQPKLETQTNTMATAASAAPKATPSPLAMSFASWTESQLELLEIEQKEGLVRHESSSKKLTVSKLQLSEVRIGAFGKTTLVLTREKPIPPGAISVGSPVRVTCPRWGSEEDPANEKRGIVKACEETRIEVICKGGDQSSNDVRLQASHEHDATVESLPDEITIKRITRALADAANSRWAQLLFGGMSPRFRAETPEFFQKHPSLLTALNDSQRHAVSLVTRALDVAVIHGPPGTGKTTTVVNAIETLLTENPSARILCCAPSNVAVDNLVSLLGRKKFRIVRLGHPSRVNPMLLEHTLDSILATSDVTELVKDAKKELMDTKDFIRKRELRKEIKQREKSFIRSVIKDSQIVLSTISSSADVGKFAPEGFTFTHLIADEAAQAMESSLWIPLQYLNPSTGVLILAGDHKQLPPTILSDQASRRGLGFTMMERIVNKHKEAGVMLSTQYRMSSLIMGWSSAEMYSGDLKAHESVALRRLADLVNRDLHTEDDDDLLDPLVFIDTSGCGLLEQEMENHEESRSNPGEVELVISHVTRLLDPTKGNLNPEQIAVVTPYRSQVEAIRSRLTDNPQTEKVEVRTVDGFQGQEREAIVLSMVRSNADRKVGFLADERRLNVAVTRAKRQVCMIGDALTLESNAFLQRLCKYFYDNGTVRSAAEFTQTFAAPIESSQNNKKASKAKNKADDSKKKTPSSKAPTPMTSVVSKPKETPTPSGKGATVPSHVKTTATISRASVQEDKITTGFALLTVDDEDDDVEEPVVVDSPKQTESTTASVSATKTSKANKKKSKPSKPKVADPETGDDDDELDFLEVAVKEANHCPFPKCGAYCELVGKNCPFCHRRYCLAHCLEEKHGCGAAARQKARENIGKSPGLKVSERVKLRQRLEDKIQKEEKNRAAVAPQKSTKKQ